MRPDGTRDDLAWTPPEDFTLETVVPDGRGGLFLVGPTRTLRLAKGAKVPVAFAATGSSSGATWRCADGTLLLGDGSVVRRVDAKGEATTVAEGFGHVFGVAQDTRGRVLVSDWERGTVTRIEEGKPTVIAKHLAHPSGLALDAGGNVYVKESGRMEHRDMRIQRIDPQGKRTLFATVPSVSRWSR